jgi:hypothetical protein
MPANGRWDLNSAFEGLSEFQSPNYFGHDLNVQYKQRKACWQQWPVEELPFRNTNCYVSPDNTDDKKKASRFLCALANRRDTYAVNDHQQVHRVHSQLQKIRTHTPYCHIMAYLNFRSYLNTWLAAIISSITGFSPYMLTNRNVTVLLPHITSSCTFIYRKG